MSSLHQGRRDQLVVGPHLWAGLGLVRGGAGTALVGSAELTLLAQRQTVRKENADAEKALTIVADKNIPYKLLRKVMYTAARANFSDVSFAVTQKVKA